MKPMMILRSECMTTRVHSCWFHVPIRVIPTQRRRQRLYHHHHHFVSFISTTITTSQQQRPITVWQRQTILQHGPYLKEQQQHQRQLTQRAECTVSSSIPQQSSLNDDNGPSTIISSTKNNNNKKKILEDGMTFHDFVGRSTTTTEPPPHGNSNDAIEQQQQQQPAQEQDHHLHNCNHMYTFTIKTYGCQMNVSDTEIVRSVLFATGKFKELIASDPIDDHPNQNNNQNERGVVVRNHHPVNVVNDDDTKDDDNNNTNHTSRFIVETPDIILTNTCAIREGAEQKVLTRLQQLRALNRKKHFPPRHNNNKTTIIGVLGCMAERLKDQLFQNHIADLVVGPDAYRSLPQLLYNLLLPPSPTSYDVDSKQQRRRRQPQMNVLLSTDETYADIIPMRQPDSENDSSNSTVSAFVSIQRGCNNRCSFCIVPFTRGVERSRPIQSIVDEIQRLHHEENVKEVTLLGQNVNSYQDQSMMTNNNNDTSTTTTISKIVTSYQLSNSGFKSRTRRSDTGYFFADLLEAVSEINPHQLRVRFTSPHPKDFPASLLQLMSERPNICNHLHMPAQSGSSTVLKRMKRGYTREAYLQLIDDVRATIPDVALSSDFIAGFCNETEEEHADTISLLQQVKYDQAFMFAYSRRDGTHAARTMDDNVPEHVKQRRLREIIDTYHDIIQTKNQNEEIGRLRLVLVEGEATKRSRDIDGSTTWRGRTDQNKRILFSVSDTEVERENDIIGISCWNETSVRTWIQQQQQNQLVSNDNINGSSNVASMVPKTGHVRIGDYAVVQVTEAKGHTLRGKLCWKSDSITSFEQTLEQLHKDSNNNQIREAMERELWT